MDYELVLFDRKNIIRDTINKYGEDKFYLSFSGGKDSTILHYLIDMAIPNNNIPRVYIETGIGLNMVSEFVKELQKKDKRIVIIQPQIPIVPSLIKYGYPFKSKLHSYMVNKFQELGYTKGVKNYLGIGDREVYRPCPQKLKYQFSSEFKIKISDKCCLKMKEEPLIKWGKDHNKTIAITGIMIEEGGRRTKGKCFVKVKSDLSFFNPMVKISSEFENWLIKEYNLKICDIYYPPYNFERTGCKGCPFALHLQNELDTLEKYFPNERKQCEAIWKPIYEEYRRISYRLKEKENEKKN